MPNLSCTLDLSYQNLIVRTFGQACQVVFIDAREHDYGGYTVEHCCHIAQGY